MFKVTKKRKFLGSVATISLLCLALTGCGNKTDKVAESTEATTTAAVACEFEIPNIHDYSGSSLYDALSFNGYPATHDYRAALAEELGYENYNDTQTQNEQILSTLKEYSAYINSDLPNETIENMDDSVEETWSDWQYYNENQCYRVSNKGNLQCQDHQYSNWTNNGTETEYSKCSVCGNIITRDIGHSFSDWYSISDTEEQRNCGICGEVEKQSHEFGAWTFVSDSLEQKKCDNCGKVISEAHQFGETTTNTTAVDSTHDKTTTSKTCNNCGYTVVTEQIVDKTNSNSTHKHSYTETVEFLSNSSETHIKRVKDACDCGKEVVEDKIEDCTFSSWTYNEKTKQYERTCQYCGKTIYTKDASLTVNPAQKKLK